MRDDDHERLVDLLRWRLDVIRDLTHLDDAIKAVNEAKQNRRSVWAILAEVCIAVSAVSALVLQFLSHH